MLVGNGLGVIMGVVLGVLVGNGLGVIMGVVLGVLVGSWEGYFSLIYVYLALRLASK